MDVRNRIAEYRFGGVGVKAGVQLCGEAEVIFVLSGLHSANTREMAKLRREIGTDTHHLETWQQFDPAMTEGKTIAGVTAGTSTPEFVIQEFLKNLEQL